MFLLAAAGAFTLLGVTHQVSEYRIVDLGPGVATAINNRDIVAGSRDAMLEVRVPNGVNRVRTSTAYSWSGGIFQILGTFRFHMEDPTSSYGFAINNAGTVVGTSGTFDVSSDGLWMCDAFIYHGVRIEPLLGTPKQDARGWIEFGTNQQALGINSSGTVVGIDQRHGFFVSSTGKVHVLSAISRFTNTGANIAAATAINDQGVIVGASSIRTSSGRSVLHAVVWKHPSNGTGTDLGTYAGYPHSLATALDNSGDIVGYVSRPTPNPDDPDGFCTSCLGPRDPASNADYPLPQNGIAVIWRRGVMTGLGVRAGANDSAALGINNDGVVVGTSGGHAVIWKAGRIEDLNNLLSRSTGWILKEANAVNDNGWIVGSGTLRGGEHGFVLIPEP